MGAAEEGGVVVCFDCDQRDDQSNPGKGLPGPTV